jgi:hypothetical protein
MEAEGHYRPARFPGAELLIRWSFFICLIVSGTVRYVLYLTITVDKTKGRLTFFLSFFTRRVGLSQKTISSYCPFKGIVK